MDQPELFYESWNAVLVQIVAALGGNKVVGRALFPEKSPEKAAAYLAECLNDDRPHALNPDRVRLLLRMARDASVHLGMYWLCDDLGYGRPSPVDPSDKMAELQRQYINSVDEQRAIADRMERLLARDSMRAVTR